jgi:predicted glycosyltransferase
MEAADLIVAMAGYNTTIEILRSGKPAVLVPRSGPSAEQRTRARLFADRGWIEMIDPGELTPDRLAFQVIENLTRETQPVAATRPNLEGVMAATSRLVDLLPNKVDPEKINMNLAEEYINGLSL